VGVVARDTLEPGKIRGDASRSRPDLAVRVLPSGRGAVAGCVLAGAKFRIVPAAIHHAVVIVRDLDASLRFYRDGLGLELLQDRQVEGDWPGLFGAPGRSLRAVFLGDPRVPDDHAGVLELNVLDGDVPAGPPPSPPVTGFFLLSFFVDVEATLGRLAGLGLGGPPQRVDQPGPGGPVTIATVRDPDGLRILLTPGSITRSA
jgi:catechol 2,3-dioxygenase-like lactoylglutathione lyase family enzyme